MPMHVKVLKEHTHDFTHNFLNIQPIFNLQKVFKSSGCPTIQSNTMYVEAFWRCHRSKITFDTSDIDII